MPDVVGGNALRAQEQMDGSQVRFEDATGKKREVVDPQAWRICDSRPGRTSRSPRTRWSSWSSRTRSPARAGRRAEAEGAP
ncbi:hypothetical protein SALBM217S_05125 [Streptomyces griseoloalbus]